MAGKTTKKDADKLRKAIESARKAAGKKTKPKKKAKPRKKAKPKKKAAPNEKRPTFPGAKGKARKRRPSKRPAKPPVVRKTIALTNRTPFPVKIFASGTKKGEAQVLCVVPAYSSSSVTAQVGDTLTAKIPSLDRVAATLKVADTGGQRIDVTERALRSNKAGKTIEVLLDAPVRNCALFRVDGRGAHKPLPDRIHASGRPVKLRLPVGSVIRGADPDRRGTYFWLIVTPSGQPNLLGLTFSTGVGWDVRAEQGEVVMFLDLGLPKLDKAASASAKNPFWVRLHGDVEDLSSLLSSQYCKLPTRIDVNPHPVDLRMYAERGEKTRAASLDELCATAAARRQSKAKGRAKPKLESRAVRVLAADTGPGTVAGLYPRSRFRGEAVPFEHSRTGALMGALKTLGSVDIAVPVEAKSVGLRTLSSLSEDYEYVRGRMRKVSRFRTTVQVEDPEVKEVEIRSWEDGARIRVGGKHYVVGPERPVRVAPNGFGRVVIEMEPTGAGAPELMLRTDAMMRDTHIDVFPDQEMHEKIARMPQDALFESGLVDKKKVSKQDCAAVQQTIQCLSRAMTHGQSETRDGRQNHRDVDASAMDHEHFAFGTDPKTGKVRHEPLDPAAAAMRAAQAQAGLAQSVLGEIGKVAQFIVGKPQQGDPEKLGEAIVDGLIPGGAATRQGLEVTFEFLEENVPAIRVLVNTSKAIGELIGKAIDAIEVGVQEFVDWLRFAFDWGDIQRTQKVVIGVFDDFMGAIKSGASSLKGTVNAEFDKLRELMTNARSDGGASLRARQSDNDGNNLITEVFSEATEKLEWIVNWVSEHLTMGESDFSRELSRRLAKLPSNLIEPLERLDDVDDDVKQSFADLGDTLEALSKGDLSTALVKLGDLMLAVGGALLNVLNTVSDVLFELFIAAIEIIEFVFNYRPKLLELRAFNQEIFGGVEIPSIIELVALIIAIPATVSHKIQFGVAPFPETSLAANAWDEFTDFLGDVELSSKYWVLAWATGVGGLMNQYTMTMALLDQPKTSGNLNILGGIVAGAKVIFYVMIAFIYDKPIYSILAAILGGIRAIVGCIDAVLIQNAGTSAGGYKRACLFDGIYGALCVVVAIAAIADGEDPWIATASMLIGAGHVAQLCVFGSAIVAVVGIAATAPIAWSASGIYFHLAGQQQSA
ncbi:hypothetical protein PPSIR1_06406 [Plesiocystis pacifica SIR-1]|uniref:Uncharacterized protein n=1 Tax=Plesiocystis pacifica SIR-1 TaxID=391625 RepID=A6GHZ1_9BACT|nr:hypothetical protein [Plesiocystis pacifica]EDM74498.1 hypothetical protein PPSIR1_06406 [Plesiocystis pacifica SIR-1]